MQFIEFFCDHDDKRWFVSLLVPLCSSFDSAASADRVLRQWILLKLGGFYQIQSDHF